MSGFYIYIISPGYLNYPQLNSSMLMTMTLDLKIWWRNFGKERSRLHVNGEIHHNVTEYLGSGVQADLLQHYFSFLLDSAQV